MGVVIPLRCPACNCRTMGHDKSGCHGLTQGILGDMRMCECKNTRESIVGARIDKTPADVPRVRRTMFGALAPENTVTNLLWGAYNPRPSSS